MIRELMYRVGIEIKRINPRPMILFVKENSKKNLIGVEIGTFRGYSAKSIMKTLSIKKLYCIDPYIEDYGDDNPYRSLSEAEEEAKNMLSKYKEVEFIKKTSDKAIKDIPDNLDFVYIDGNHDYKFVKRDIKNYFKKLKVGGVLGGHDFYNGLNPEHDGVVRAVLDIFKKHKLYIHYPDWWIIKSKEVKGNEKRI